MFCVSGTFACVEKEKKGPETERDSGVMTIPGRVREGPCDGVNGGETPPAASRTPGGTKLPEKDGAGRQRRFNATAGKKK